ncbi:cilia- and flagella-associated protein 58-like [Halichondria panicea]|uniref:cilia- and flagella-associated protein 58-like n=1 Tax=Halichondria panicea TaxID=6063 RepID=UPI00312BBFF7
MEENKAKAQGPGDGNGKTENSFESLEKDFQEVLAELMGDKSLERFRIEYEKLHRALKKSHESEKRLMHKCRELNSEIVANSAKVSTALKLSQEDKSTISSLKQEIEKLWKMVDAAHDKEARARDTINQLKLEIANLTKLVEQGAGLGIGQDSSVEELVKQKEELISKRDSYLEEIVQLRQTIQTANESQKSSEHEREVAEMKVNELREEITAKNQEMDRENRRKVKLEKDLKSTIAELEVRTMEAKSKQNQVLMADEEYKRCEQQLRETRTQFERTVKDNDILNQRLTKAQQDYENQLMQSDQLAGENSQKHAELKIKEEEVTGLKGEITRLSRLREKVARNLRSMEEQKMEVEGHREKLKQEIASMEREMEAQQKKAELDKKAFDDLVRERDILTKGMRKAEGTSEKMDHLVKTRNQAIQRLQQEIANYREEAKKQRQLIQSLERERDRYGKDAADAHQGTISQMEEVKRKEMQLYQLKKQIVEIESKLKQQHTLYEAVCSDRNLCSKNLIEARDEITEMKRKLKIMSHQIDQLKEEIASKEGALVKSNMDLVHIERDKESLSSELSARKQELETTKQLMENQRAEERKLRKIISEASAERTRQKKELEQVINERDILGTQLIRRNDELALLYEKIKIQQSTLNKGEMQYSQRLEDIRILKLEIKKMRRERGILSKNVANIDDLRRELYHIQRELLKERTRCKALEEELENPMNIHRWRKLEGSDPSTYEMIQKIHTLQRRLIQKTEEVVEKELLIQEKEKLYMELKQILQRQPGPEVAEQLQIYQQTLKEKTKQMKCMASELNMYDSQVSEHKMDIDRLQRELQEVKKNYYLQKKKEHQKRERDRVLGQGLGPPIIPLSKADMPRFAGGGFNLKQSQKA